MAILNFDPRAVAPLAALEPVPAGWYKVAIVKTNTKPTAAGDGDWYLELVMQILEGAYQGRSLWWNLNLGNKSQESQRISGAQLSAICHCIGYFEKFQDQPGQDGATPMLHNVPFYVLAAVDPKGNSIKGCKDIHGNDPGKQANQPAAPAPAIPAFGTSPQQAGGIAPPGYTPQVATPVIPAGVQTVAGAPWSAGNGQMPQIPQNANPLAVTPPMAAPLQPAPWPPQGATTPAAPAAAPGTPWQQGGMVPGSTPPWQK